MYIKKFPVGVCGLLYSSVLVEYSNRLFLPRRFEFIALLLWVAGLSEYIPPQWMFIAFVPRAAQLFCQFFDTCNRGDQFKNSFFARVSLDIAIIAKTGG
jgi:hypothetical protein